MAELSAFSASHSAGVRQAIEQIFAERREAAEKLTPHLVESVEALGEFSLRGGKYVRPMLVLLAAQLSGAAVTDASYQVAAGVELFHKHILNLDDMADRDEVRNGGPTVWKAYEQRFANWKDASHHARSFTEINGTLLGSFAFELVRRSNFPAEDRLAVMDVLNNRMYFETIAGWQIHYFQNQEKLADAQEAEFLHGLDLVTSRYTFVGPLHIGLIISGNVSRVLADSLEQFGLKVGMAFQLTDDVLGLFGDPQVTGKAIGNDLREGKKTVLLQTAYRNANADDQSFLAEVCGRDLQPGELERAQTIVQETGALAASQQLAQECITDALQVLKKMRTELPDLSELQLQALRILDELAQSIINRKK